MKKIKLKWVLYILTIILTILYLLNVNKIINSDCFFGATLIIVVISNISTQFVLLDDKKKDDND